MAWMSGYWGGDINASVNLQVPLQSDDWQDGHYRVSADVTQGKMLQPGAPGVCRWHCRARSFFTRPGACMATT